MIESVLVSPQAVVSNHRVLFNKKLLEWVVDFSLQHPTLNHLQNRC